MTSPALFRGGVVDDGMSARVAPFERVGIYRYRSARGEFMVSNLGIEVREVDGE